METQAELWLEIAWAAAKFLNGSYDWNGKVATPQLELVTAEIGIVGESVCGDWRTASYSLNTLPFTAFGHISERFVFTNIIPFKLFAFSSCSFKHNIVFHSIRKLLNKPRFE